jgi:hypothetical protein
VKNPIRNSVSLSCSKRTLFFFKVMDRNYSVHFISNTLDQSVYLKTYTYTIMLYVDTFQLTQGAFETQEMKLVAICHEFIWTKIIWLLDPFVNGHSVSSLHCSPRGQTVSVHTYLISRKKNFQWILGITISSDSVDIYIQVYLCTRNKKLMLQKYMKSFKNIHI